MQNCYIFDYEFSIPFYFMLLIKFLAVWIMLKTLILKAYFPAQKNIKLFCLSILINLGIVFLLIPLLWYFSYNLYRDFAMWYSAENACSLYHNIVGFSVVYQGSNLLINEWTISIIAVIFSCLLEYKFLSFCLKEVDKKLLKKVIILGNVASYLLMMIFETIWLLVDCSYLIYWGD